MSPRVKNAVRSIHIGASIGLIACLLIDGYPAWVFAFFIFITGAATLIHFTNLE